MTPQAFDDAAFHDFEQNGWQRAAEYYGDAFGALTSQTAPALLDTVQAGRGTRLVDVACGPGFIAQAAVERGAAVIGIDFAPAMVGLARHRHPAVDFREGDAQQLPLDDSSVDAVVMNFGMLHLARPDAAIAEAARVLRPGGRYAFTVWASPARAVGFGLVLRAIEDFGSGAVPLPEGPPFFRFSDADATRAALAQAGFVDIDVRELPLTWRVPSGDHVFDAFTRGGVRTAAVLRGQTPEALAAIRDAVLRGVDAFADADGFSMPMPAVLASGTSS
jgi:SAM-dependent methyltransferase